MLILSSIKPYLELFRYAFAADVYEQKLMNSNDNINIDGDCSVTAVPENAAAEAERAGLRLLRDENGCLTLTDGSLSICADLCQNLRRLRPDNLNRELLVRTAKIKHASGKLTAVDATAGFGEDSLLLAAAGFHVKLYEYDSVICALLADALRRAASVPGLKETAAKMELINADSISAMNAFTERPDVILLDPMFPAREKSALIKKKFQLLQRLEQPCADEEAMLNAAVAAHPCKIVIKRPLKGPFLADRKPDYSIKGKAIRYDCIVLA